MAQKWIVEYLETMDMQRGEQEPNVMLIWNRDNPSITMYGRAASYHPDDYLKALMEFMQQDSEFEKWIERYIDDADVLAFTDILGVLKMNKIRMAKEVNND